MSGEKRKDSRRGKGGRGGFQDAHPPEAVWTKPIMGWVRYSQIQSAWCGGVQKLKPNNL
jgi:hypothetical protein